jgi:hypothetical protein
LTVIIEFGSPWPSRGNIHSRERKPQILVLTGLLFASLPPLCAHELKLRKRGVTGSEADAGSSSGGLVVAAKAGV